MNGKSEDMLHHQTGSISSDLNEIMPLIKNTFSETPDLVIRKLTIKQTNEQALLIYIEGLTEKIAINQDVLRPLQQEPGSGQPGDELIMNVGLVELETSYTRIETAILQGSSILFVSGRKEAFILDTRGWPQRAIQDSQLESSLKGAHQGFVETGGQNIAMIRRYISDRELKMKRLTVGRRGKTAVTILFLADVTNPELIEMLEQRINKLDVDVILNAGELSELIEDNPFSVFPQFVSTERPDSAASQLMQGRCVIVVDRSPNVLIAPVTFLSFFQNIDDYSIRWPIATFLRLLRLFAFFTAAFLPAFYIAVVSFHFEIIPMKLLMTLGESRGQVPFPPFVEAILMEMTLEMLREAGIRLPAPIGQTVGIVGGIVIGQAVVQAGLISNIMVIVVAFTAISSFILPNYDMVAAVRLIRFILMGLATAFGFVGLVVGLMIMVAHLITQKSLGMPYGSPIGPMRFADWKDALARVPIWLIRNRPTNSAPLQRNRSGKSDRKEKTNE